MSEEGGHGGHGGHGHGDGPLTVISFNKGGHPTGAELVVGGVLIILGFLIFLTWVATFDNIWALGLLPLVCGFILVFHADPILETLHKWRETGRPPARPTPPARSS